MQLNLLMPIPNCESIRENKAFNADPAALIGKVINEDRIYIMAPGEAFKL